MPIVYSHALRDNKIQRESRKLIVNNLNTQNLLIKAFDGYQGLDMKLEDWKFDPPPLNCSCQPSWNLHDELKNDSDGPADKKS